MANSTVKNLSLPFWTCIFVDTEPGNQRFPTSDPDLVYRCKPVGEFYVGSSPTSQNVGHAICILMVILIWLLGLFGMVTNLFNVLIVPRSMRKLSGSLSHLLVALALFEFLTAASAIAFSTTILVILENADRGAATLYMLKVTYAFYTFGRVAFIYTTILVSIERFLVVAFPSKAETFLTPTKRKLYFVAVVIIALLTDLPLILDASVEENVDAKESLPDFPYYYKYTKVGNFLFPWFTYYGQLMIKTWIPVPVLLLFNGLLYRSIKRWNQRRESLTRGQKREINVATMLMTVVLLVTLWNTPYYIAFVSELLIQDKRTYREIQFVKIMCITASTSINFLMYYRNSSEFKREVGKYLHTVSEQEPESSHSFSESGIKNKVSK